MDPSRRPDILRGMSESPYRLEDLGDHRVLTVGGRKGPARTPPYFSYKETRGRLFLDPLFGYLRGRGAHDLSVLEVGCSFGHITEYLADRPEVREVTTFDTDPAFAAIVRVKVEEMALGRVKEVGLFSNEETRS